VIGIPTLAGIDPENQQLAGGFGFAIPSNTVKEIAGQIIQHGRVVDSGRAHLGVRLATLQSGQGALVVSVSRGGPAETAGVAAGDAITAIDGRHVASIDDIATRLADLRPGTKVTLAIRTSSGRSSKVVITTGQYSGS
jgi:putative serine protease PepD